MEATDNKPNGRNKFKEGNTYGKGRPKGSRNREKVTKEDILMEIQQLYQYALGNHNWSVALQVKMFQAKILGMLRTRKLPNITRLSEMNEDELREFIEILEESEPELKELNPYKGMN